MAKLQNQEVLIFNKNDNILLCKLFSVTVIFLYKLTKITYHQCSDSNKCNYVAIAFLGQQNQRCPLSTRFVEMKGWQKNKNLHTDMLFYTINVKATMPHAFNNRYDSEMLRKIPQPILSCISHYLLYTYNKLNILTAISIVPTLFIIQQF